MGRGVWRDSDCGCVVSPNSGAGGLSLSSRSITALPRRSGEEGAGERALNHGVRRKQIPIYKTCRFLKYRPTPPPPSPSLLTALPIRQTGGGRDLGRRAPRRQERTKGDHPPAGFTEQASGNMLFLC
uniref:Uncharacterized protein n=1 Tax=Nothobranchius furzeri TaxID=105023 RepID=A0A1A8UF32_NOTFU